MPLSKGITDKALPQCKDHTIIFFRLEKMCKEKQEYKKEKRKNEPLSKHEMPLLSKTMAPSWKGKIMNY
jgi:hypothetical protein